MIEKEFKKLINKDKYQVFLFSCHVPIPLNIAVHYWFVINKKGKIDRWEILAFPKQCKTSWRHLHKNVALPTTGLNKILYKRYLKSKSNLILEISGKKGSTAEKMVKFIEKSPQKYPFWNKYFLFGPNSNTYTRWVLDHFPELKFKLSWRAIGKSFLKKH